MSDDLNNYQITKERDHVILVDPNYVNINYENGFVNGIPKYEDMFIFAELTATSKGRTIIDSTGINSTNTVTINLLGVNQDNTTPNSDYLNFTTNYYDGSMGGKDIYESFGISAINIKINSSFIPQVNIQFVDIRGLSFFNNEKSPYRILFDFPPPTFKLKIKGYYGKALTYELHLVKYTTEFKAENGNFVIDAQFVAMTFAPLSDILFRYVTNIAMVKDFGMTPIPNAKPRNTYDLILKLKSLYSSINEKIKAEPESKRFEIIRKNIEIINGGIDKINSYKDDTILSKDTNQPLLIINSTTNLVEKTPTNDWSLIDNTLYYDKIIQKSASSGININPKDRLYIGYAVGANSSTVDDEDISNFPPTIAAYDGNTSRMDDLVNSLNKYAETLISTVNNVIPNITISNASSNVNYKKNVATGDDFSTRYAILDITSYYISLYKQKTNLNKEKQSISDIISTKVNSMIITELGMIPTIYNVFKIILDDVDQFFTEFRKYAFEAETDHKRDINKIANGTGSFDVNGTKIYAYPLIMEPKDGRNERVAPIKLRRSGISFPELTFVDIFIKSFQEESSLAALYDFRNNQNDDGTFKWVPISPVDSKIGGASNLSPYIPNNINNATIQIFQTIIERYYMLSQGIFPDEFGPNTIDSVSGAYQGLFAEAEAANLAEVLSLLPDDKTLKFIKTSINTYLNDIKNFYKDINKISLSSENTLYSFVNDVDYFQINPDNSDVGKIYVDKINPNFVGLSIYENAIPIQNATDINDATKPVDYFKKNSGGVWIKNLAQGRPSEFHYDFTEQNFLYVSDYNSNKIEKNIVDTSTGTVLTTRYVGYNENQAGVNLGSYGYYLSKVSFSDAYDYGNNFLGGPKYVYNFKNLTNLANVVDVWVQELNDNGHYLEDKVINTNSKLSALLILANFGWTFSPFNTYPNDINSLIFNTAAGIEVPKFLILYLGALVDAINNDWENEIIDYFTNDSGKYLKNGGIFIAADLHDIKQYLSTKDSETFSTAFNDFYNAGGLYSTIQTNLAEYWKTANESITGTTPIYKNLHDALDVLLNPNSTVKTTNIKGLYFGNILQPVIERETIITYSQITFKMDNSTYGKAKYNSLSTRSTNDKTKNIDNNYFKTLFKKLDNLLIFVIKTKKEEQTKIDKLTSNEDIITQTYYSFKNINDKWISGKGNSINGYPFNVGGKNLIDSFAFVDRAMNPIGDTILNAEILIQLFDDPDVSLFSVISQLLSVNGFEFFPLQNFMNFNNADNWTDSFKINLTTDNANNTAFVCMYIGGASSYLSTSNSSNGGFENDGIIDITNPDAPEFNSAPSSPLEDQETNNKDFPWRQVRAFRVRFGTQNQSMFSDIKIDSKEYLDTNESIQILSRMAGDNKINEPTPIGQSLYSIYESRSYKASITGLGNAMIQPTQYFQLENIPMYNGAYIILNVEHNIMPNKMTTTFSGTKLSRYPVPRVLNPIALVGIDNLSELSGGEITQVALLSNNTLTHHNSMYTLKIT